MAHRRSKVKALIDSDRLEGRKYIRVLEDHLRQLHASRPHANRRLFFDHVVVAHLLAFFNPALRGLRSIGELFNDRRVRKRYGSPRVPKSTLADAQRMFDPELLVGLIRQLREHVRISRHDARLDDLTQKLLAVDGTFFTVAPRIAWAVFNQNDRPGKPGSTRKGGVCVHTQFDILRGIPNSVSLTDGATKEHHELKKALESNCLYVLDRGYVSLSLALAIIAAQSDFVLRIRQSDLPEPGELRPLTPGDQAAGIVEDAIIQRPDTPPLRRVTLRFTERTGKLVTMRLLTSRLDLPAEIIALIYKHRWQVELFFRWLKCLAHFEHFFSESPAGMTLQIYVTIIGTLLIALVTGGKPSKYDYALMACALNGITSLDHVIAMAEKRRAAQSKSKKARQ